MSQGLSKTRAEVKDLQRLRQLFLEAPAHDGLADYWADETLLSLYDTTFARRIGWKWDAVLSELAARCWKIPSNIRRWVDWGCGSGIAGEVLISRRHDELPEAVVFSDRSLKARLFASKKASEISPQAIKITHESPELLQCGEADLLLVSHVLNELKTEQLNSLLEQAKNAGCLLWVEPGTPHCSKKLSEIRDELLNTFDAVAPCPHQLACPLRGAEGDWCHFFAAPPPHVFQDAFWANFSKEFNIDLRSLPVSFLVMQKKGLQPCNPSGNDRIIARPRFYKGFAKMLVCGAGGKAQLLQLQQRNHKAEFKMWEKDCFFAEITSARDSD